MKLHPLMASAAKSAADVARGVRPEQLELPTPCAEYDVRALVNHLVVWTAYVSEFSARKEPLTDPSLLDPDRDFTGGDWAQDYAAQLDRAVAAWGEPGAGEGMTSMGGHDPQMPAEVIAEMLFGELVVHGWDLARATGQRFEVTDEVADRVYAGVAQWGGQAREMKLFGEPVDVPPTASRLDQALGLTGRDPGWQRP
jgi:uncharacterized protein (TIGR03086 family)